MNAPQILTANIGFRGPHARYFGELPVLELPPLDHVRLGTFTRWRKEVPAEARFVPRVPDAVALAGFVGDEAAAGWERTRAIASRLRAELVLLRTPSTFRPTAENRAAMKAFFADRAGDPFQVAWWADGLWESQPEARDEVADAAGLIPVVDPLALDDDEPLPAGAQFYWRLLGRLGLSGRYSDHDLYKLLELAQGRDSGVIVFTSARMRPDALRFHGMVAAGGAELAVAGDDPFDDFEDDEGEDDDEAFDDDSFDDDSFDEDGDDDSLDDSMDDDSMDDDDES
ncbi:MAG: DUF72 domain-containing protein [Myxococcales bacterium]|nr:DUF72 domain-containing protein [Myxococcales bacterium]MCB9548369.1 DUF72 domain-containing protein [Myxococcales bacterium]